MQMAESHSKLEITAKVVDLGDRVIQLHHVVSAGRHATHPFRPLGLLLLVIGIGLVAGEAVLRGTVAFKLQTGGSLPLWIGFAAAGIGLFLSLFARRMLVIRTSDGARTVIPSADEETASALILRIRQAMEAAGGPATPAQPQVVPAMLAPPEHTQTLPVRTGPPLGLPQHPLQPAARSQPAADATSPHTIPAGRTGDGYVNGHGGRGFPGQGAPEGVPLREQASLAQRLGGAPQQQLPTFGSLSERRAGAVEAGHQQGAPREPLALPTGAPRDDGPHDLAALMEHVRRSDVQHKEALLDLLRVVEDFHRGRASRDDAIAHWRSFADYVVQYLSDVDGLIAHTERFGRHMLAR